MSVDPIALFRQWYADAESGGIVLPEAACLSTATAEGRPSNRMVLVKTVDERGFVFFTNYTSRKAEELDANPHASLLWHWTTLERQVRVEGKATRISSEESDAYFATRPHGSQIGAWASRQSARLESRSDLEAEVARYATRFGDDVPRPDFWGGYRVEPRLVEFWEGKPDRLHDRTVFTPSEGGGWTTHRLNP